MNMIKKVIEIITIASMVFISGCSKKKNVQLGQTYYKLALVELADEDKKQSSPRSRLTQALLHIEKAIKEESRPEYYALKATLLFRLDHNEESNLFFEKALASHPDPTVRAEITNNYACLLAHMGKLRKACALWHELEYDKHYITPEVACFNKGKVALASNKLHTAKKHFAKAIALAPNYVDAHYLLALVAYKLGEKKQAQQELTTVLHLEPSHHQARVYAQQWRV